MLFIDNEIISSVEVIYLKLVEDNLIISLNLQNESNVDIKIASGMRLLFNIQTNNSAIALNIGNISSLTMNVTTTCSGVMTTFNMGNYFIVKFCDIVILLFSKLPIRMF